jgi:hypothetical protein
VSKKRGGIKPEERVTLQAAQLVYATARKNSVTKEESEAARLAYNAGEIDGDEYAKRSGHAPHMGGLPLTTPQLEMLLRAKTGKVGASGLVEYPCASINKAATAKALKARGLIDVWWMASRLFAVRLTAKGRAHYLIAGEADKKEKTE